MWWQVNRYFFLLNISSISVNTYLIVDEQDLSLSLFLFYTHKHQLNICVHLSLSHIWSIYFLFLYWCSIQTTKGKKRYGSNYCRIIECSRIVLISFLLISLWECDRFMQYYCTYMWHEWSFTLDTMWLLFTQ